MASAVAGLYCPRHPERTFLYRVLFYYFDMFLVEYEQRFEKEYEYPTSGAKGFDRD